MDYESPLKARSLLKTIDGYPEPIRERLLALRTLIHQVARQTPGVGELEETLKWGQLAFLTAQSGSGSGSGTTVRIDHARNTVDSVGIYTSCQTPLVEEFRMTHGGAFKYDKNRGIVFDVEQPLDEDAIGEFVAAALTYHLRKRDRG